MMPARLLLLAACLAAPAGAADAPAAPSNEELLRLRREDPAAYRAALLEIRAGLAEIRELDPAAFRAVMDRRRERLQEMKSRDPARYRRILDRRREYLRNLKRDDPDRYRGLMRDRRRELERTGPRGNRPASPGAPEHGVRRPESRTPEGPPPNRPRRRPVHPGDGAHRPPQPARP